MRIRKFHLVATVASATAVALAGSLVAPAQAAAPVTWGASIRASAGQTQLQAVQSLQTKVGRTLAATRDFLLWNSPFPTAYENGLKAQGTTVILSVATDRTDKTKVLWANIANAAPGSTLDTEMRSWADRARSFGAPMYVTLQHEPEAATNTSEGTATDYINAWRKWVSIFRAEGATNVKFMWIMTAFSFRVPTTDRRYADKWYPGDAYVDGIASDAYNFFTCHNNVWNPLSVLLSGQLRFIASHPSEEVWVTEFGSIADPAVPGRRGQWIADAQALLKTAPYVRFQGILYFDIKNACDNRIDTDSQAIAAFRTMGQDPFYGGPGTPFP